MDDQSSRQRPSGRNVHFRTVTRGTECRRGLVCVHHGHPLCDCNGECLLGRRDANSEFNYRLLVRDASIPEKGVSGEGQSRRHRHDQTPRGGKE